MVEGVLMSKFEDFWNIYPRKVDKKRARLSFKRLSKKVQDECIEGVRNYIKQIEIKGTEKQYIKHPSTFINGENWEDEFETEVIKVLSYEDFKLDSTGNARIGYCKSCNKSDFYDRFKIHQEESRCCKKELMTCKNA